MQNEFSRMTVNSKHLNEIKCYDQHKGNRKHANVLTEVNLEREKKKGNSLNISNVSEADSGGCT